MFRVIHPNRWFFWTIALLIGTALALLAFVYKTTQEFEDQAANLAWSGQNRYWKTYTSDEMKFSIQYPHAWQIELDREALNTVSFQNPRNYDENVSVSAVDPKYEKIIRDSLSIASESDIQIDGIAGKRLESKNPKDTAVSSVILIVHNGKLYEIAGQAKGFDRIINSLKFN